MDPVQVVNSVAAALGESSGTVEAVFRGLFREIPDAGPADWSGVEQVLYAQPIVEHGKIAALLDALKALVSEAGRDGDPRLLFDDHELRGRFATDTRAPVADEPVATPVAQGSLIRRVGDAYYLGDAHQVWRAASGDTVYYHDGTQNYDTLGRPLDAPDAAPPAGGQTENPEAWNSYLAQNGPRWDGTDQSWQQFRDWFLYDAAAHGVGASARGFIALAERGDRRAVFTAYGLTLPIAASSGAGGTAGGALSRLDVLRALVNSDLTTAVPDMWKDWPNDWPRWLWKGFVRNFLVPESESAYIDRKRAAAATMSEAKRKLDEAQRFIDGGGLRINDDLTVAAKDEKHPVADELRAQGQSMVDDASDTAQTAWQMIGDAGDEYRQSHNEELAIRAVNSLAPTPGGIRPTAGSKPPVRAGGGGVRRSGGEGNPPGGGRGGTPAGGGGGKPPGPPKAAKPRSGVMPAEQGPPRTSTVSIDSGSGQLPFAPPIAEAVSSGSHYHYVDPSPYQRPLLVEGWVYPKAGSGRAAGSGEIQDFTTGGGTPGLHGAHLFPDHDGGAPIGPNVVPFPSRANQSSMGTAENAIKAYREAHGDVYLQVYTRYKYADPSRMPASPNSRVPAEVAFRTPESVTYRIWVPGKTGELELKDVLTVDVHNVLTQTEPPPVKPTLH